VALGIDGPDAATHDAFRGTPGSFSATRAAVAAAGAAGLALQVETTVTRRTVEELPRTAALVADLRPELWTVVFVVPGGGVGVDRQLGPDSCERVFQFLFAWTERTGFAATTAAAPAYRRVVVQQQALRPGTPVLRPLPLNDGKGLLFVSHGGDVRPSAFLPLRGGNVRDAPAAEIYRRSRLFRALRDPSRLGGKCGRCPFRSLCGGSRARAYAATGNFLAEDPTCVYQPPESWTWSGAPRRRGEQPAGRRAA
jgi:radical SAM protein with 4Fe4S-binding SPASM domain